MGSEHSRECREHGEQIRALCRQLLVDQASSRLAACGALIMLAPGDRDLAQFLRAQRRVEMAQLFAVSLRLDVAIQAVKELAADVFSQTGAQTPHWTEQSVFNRLNSLIFGQSEDDHGGVAGRLCDSGRYLRSRRTRQERELIELLDEALQRRDDGLRNQALGRFWSWSVKLCQTRCRDPDVSQDLVSEAIVHLLNTATPSISLSTTESDPVIFPPPLENFLPLSGVELLSRMHATLFGHQTATGSWPGLLNKHISNVSALKEVAWDVAGTDCLYAPLAEVANHPPVNLSPQQIHVALDIFREELDEQLALGALGPKGAQALRVILDHVQVCLLRQHDDEDAMAVVSVRYRPAIESESLLPYLVGKLGIKRPKNLLQRVLAIGDVLTEAQLYDRHLATLPINNEQDLSKILDRLRINIADGNFRKTPRQRQTLEALIELWEGTNMAQAVDDTDCSAVCLPPLLTWSKTVHIHSAVIQALKDALGMDGTAAHNCIKRQLELLDTWGLVKELRDE